MKVHEHKQHGTPGVYVPRKTCRACDSNALTEVLDLGIQYLPRFVEEPDESLPKAPLNLVRCAGCGLLQLQHTTNPDLLFREFWYRSGINQSMREALNNVIESALHYHPRGVWLDIGANDGYLLSRVPSSFYKIAVEPALNFREELHKHCHYVSSTYFGEEDMPRDCDVITSCAMFYDLDDPGPFLDEIRKCLSKDGIWINQLNDAPTMLKRNAFDSICHEHLCYYDIHSLRLLYEDHGLKIVNVSFNEVNGGSMRVYAERKCDSGRPADILGIPHATRTETEAFAGRIKRWREVMGELVVSLGPGIWGYGASTKGAVLMQYLDLPGQFLAIADRNHLKHGLRMVGTWTPIVDEVTFRKEKPRYALVLPWAFRDEFMEREAHTRAMGTTMIFPLPQIELCV